MTSTDADAMDRLELEEKTGSLVLTVIDEGDWSDEDGHIARLQDRLNACLRLVENGEVFLRMREQLGRPVSKSSPIQIRVVAQHAMSPTGARFFEYARGEFSEAKVGLVFRLAADEWLTA